MRIITRTLCILLCLHSSSVSEILWTYSLSQLPPGWTHRDFQFYSLASTYLYVWESGPLAYGANYLQTDSEWEVSGWDSLVIDVSQSVEILNGGGSTHGYIQLLGVINGSPEVLWERSHSVSGTFVDSTPIHGSLSGFVPGDRVCFMFKASAIAGMYSSVKIWWSLWDATLSAYGEASLDQSTWAEIKQLL
jgi:hypothetical protein